MARLQILELPAGANDDRPPFVLVIDQVTNPESYTGSDEIRELLEARAVLLFEETVDIPANVMTTGPDGYPLKFRIEPDFEMFREQVEEEIRYAQGKVTRALHDEQASSLAAEVQRLRAGEEPVTDEGIVPSPGQWIWHWNRATPEKRLSVAAQIQYDMTRSSNCFMADHEAQIKRLRTELKQLRAECGPEE